MLKGVLQLTNNAVGLFFLTFSGFAIYFGYGIRHSTQAAAARSSSDTEMYGLGLNPKLESTSPEKEAFLPDGIDVKEENDGAL